MRYVLLFFIIFTGCKPAVENEKLELETKAKEALNSRNYDQANLYYQRLLESSPHSRKYKKALADSHLGLGGFELFDFLIAIDRLMQNSFEGPELLKEVRSFVAKYLFIDNDRKDHLEKALAIYYQLDGQFEARSREDKLKKGLVHIFMLTQALKELIQKIQNTRIKSDPWQDAQRRAREFVEKYVVHVDEMIFHGFNAYRNLKGSFKEIGSLLKELDRAIFAVFGVPYQEIEEELKDMSIEKFIQLFIKYNPELYAQIMKELFQTCKRELALVKIIAIEKIIKSDYRNHEFQQYALRAIRTIREYIENHDRDVCESI